MAKFFSEALSIIGRLYRLSSTESRPERIDLNSPLQIVHDASREAELGAFETKVGCAGWWEMNLRNTHGAADTQDSSASALALGDATVIDTNKHWSWLMRPPAFQSDSNTLISSVKVDVTLNVVPRNGVIETVPGNYLVAFQTGFTGVAATFRSLDNLGFSLTTTALPQLPVQQFPFPLFTAGGIRFRSVSTGIAVVTMNALIWTGPIGVNPPGAL